MYYTAMTQMDCIHHMTRFTYGVLWHDTLMDGAPILLIFGHTFFHALSITLFKKIAHMRLNKLKNTLQEFLCEERDVCAILKYQ